MTYRVASISFSAFALAALAGCGGGGGNGGGGGEARRVFVLPHVLEASGRISRVATGDFNGDGIPDLVEIRESPTRGVAIEFSSALRESPSKQSLGKTSLERGAAGYEPDRAHVLVWDSAVDLCVADVDRDGCPDLVVAGGSARQVGVWRCDPVLRDEFLPPLLLDTTGSADRVAVCDMDGDGRLDIVTIDESTGQPTEMLQLSLLSFKGMDPPAIGACHGLVLADMDRDGRMDLVTNDPIGDRVLFLVAGGASGFMIRESPTKQSTGRAMAVGDVDGDGWLDVVVVDEGGHAVTCLHQRPMEPLMFDSVHSPLSTPVDEQGVECTQIAIGDPGVNGRYARALDGGSEAGSVGDCLLRESPTRRSYGQAGCALADLDRDGHLDLVCSPLAMFPAADMSPVIAFGSMSMLGGFEASVERAGPVRLDPTPAACLCVCDLDLDGHLDIAESFFDFPLMLDYFEDGGIPTQADFAERVAIDVPLTNDCTTADLDRDGLPDCVLATTTGLEVRFQNAAAPGTFLAPMILGQGQDCRAVAVGDVNGDGCPDLVVCAGSNGGTFLRDPMKPRSFLPVVPFPAPPQGTRFVCVVLGDLDADGHLDLVAIRESPTKAHYGHGNAKSPSFFDVFTEVSLGVSSPTGLALDDLDGDGDLDLAVSGDGPDGSSIVLQDGHVTVLKMAAPQTLPLQRGVRVATGDVNGDGRVDVVTSGDEGVAVALQSHEVRGRFLAAYALSSEACGGLALADMDRDGDLDVCFVEMATGTLACVTGDPDFDLLRVLSLNGLPPGVPVRSVIVVASRVIGDPDFDLLRIVPRSGSTTATIRMFGTGP